MIKFNILKTMATDTKALRDLASTLYVSDEDLYESYLIKPLKEYGYDAFPYDGCDPYEMESSGNYRYKFIEIGIDDDTIGLFFKTYDMYGITGSYLWIRPISLQGNKEHEKEVFQYLKDNKIIDNILIPQCIPNIDYTNRHIRNDEYYCKVLDRWTEISKSKYRSKKGINKIEKDYNIVTKLNDFNPADIQNIRYHWWKLHKKANKPFDKTIDFLLNLPNNQRDVLTWELDNKLIGFTIITYYFNDLKTARIIQNVNLLKTEIDDTDSFMTSHLADYMHYKTIEHLYNKGINYAYIGDAHGEGAFLAPYKKRNFKLHNYNYDLPIEEYDKLFY